MDINIDVLVCLAIAISVPIVLFLLLVFFVVIGYFFEIANYIMEEIRMWKLRKNA